MGRRQTKILLTTDRTNLDYSQFKSLCNSYKKLLSLNPFPVQNNYELHSHISYFKRRLFTIGPYENITVFEAANRIATDLVLFKGVKAIIKSSIKAKTSVTIRLGNEYVKGKGDFEFNGRQGEVFNVAPSFFKSKLGKTLNGVVNKGTRYVLFNKEAVIGNESYFNLKQKEHKIKFIAVDQWHKI